MKKLLSLCAAIALVAVPALSHGQGFGIKGGLSYDNVKDRGLLPGDAKQRTGFAIGVGLNTGGVIGFGVEGLYAQRGLTSNTVGASRELDYIDVPAYLHIAIPTTALTPWVYAGPQASFELKCDANGADCPSGRAKTSYSAVIGAGLRVLGVSLEGRYVYGLTDLKLNTVTSSDSYKSRSFMILAGIGF